MEIQPKLKRVVKVRFYFAHKRVNLGCFRMIVNPLLPAGCWHAPNKNYLYGTRNNMHIIDIASTEQHLWRALNVVSQTAFDGGTVLFVNNRAGYGHILEVS